MYVVVVQVHVKPAAAESFIQATRENHSATQTEAGNLRFDVLQQTDDPERFVLYEVYQDESSFQAHQQTAHYLRWRDTVSPMMVEPRRAQKLASVVPDPWN
jgi:autoinducer 2-degrading protein